jgi:single-strand DNA-binding protein
MSEATTLGKPAKSLRLMEKNHVELVGRLTAAPVIRMAGSSKVAQFQLAVNRRYKVKDEWKDDTNFVTIVAWNKLAELCEKRTVKGTPICVEGRLRSETWEDKGEKRYGVKVESSRIQILERTKTEPSADKIPFGE